MGVATAIAVSAAVGAAGSMYASSQSSKAQKKTNAANQQMSMETNAQNERLFHLGRGGYNEETGYSNAILPEYFKNRESELAAGADAQYAKIMGQTDTAVAGLQQDSLRLAPAYQTSLQSLLDRYNGKSLEERLANAQPVFAARDNFSGAQAAGINTGLAQQIGQLEASRAAQGFLGGSSYDRNRMLMATVGARQGAASAMAGSRLANAEDERALRDQFIADRMDTSPLTTYLNNATYNAQQPISAQGAGYAAAMQPYQFFKLNPSQFQNAQLPLAQATMSNGQIIGQAAGQLGGAATNYFTSQALAQQYAQPQSGYSAGLTNYIGTGSTTNPSAYRPNPYA